MKRIHKLTVAVLSAMILLGINGVFAQGGAAINTTGAPADPSAILDISSTTQGLLAPRMTELQRTNISLPVAGLMVYQTDNTTGFWYYDGAQWVQAVGPAGPIGATGFLASGNAAGNTPYWDGTQWVVNSSNIHNAGSSVGIGTNTPETTAKLDVSSTTQGMLMPRMTEVQRNAINLPATGLLVYQTDATAGFYYYDGTAWTAIGGGGGGGAADPTLLYTIDGF